MGATAELGRNPVSKHRIQPEYGDEQADAGRDCRTLLAKPNSQARTRIGEYTNFLYPDDNTYTYNKALLYVSNWVEISPQSYQYLPLNTVSNPISW